MNKNKMGKEHRNVKVIKRASEKEVEEFFKKNPNLDIKTSISSRKFYKAVKVGGKEKRIEVEERDIPWAVRESWDMQRRGEESLDRTEALMKVLSKRLKRLPKGIKVSPKRHTFQQNFNTSYSGNTITCWVDWVKKREIHKMIVKNKYGELKEYIVILEKTRKNEKEILKNNNWNIQSVAKEMIEKNFEINKKKNSKK